MALSNGSLKNGKNGTKVIAKVFAMASNYSLFFYLYKF
jgi:hypothetical protein